MSILSVNLLRRLWHDEWGFLVSAELVLIATVGVLGLVVGLHAVSHAVVAELNDVASAVGAVSQTYRYNGLYKWGHGYANGAGYFDRQDACDCRVIVDIAPSIKEQDIAVPAAEPIAPTPRPAPRPAPALAPAPISVCPPLPAPAAQGPVMPNAPVPDAFPPQVGQPGPSATPCEQFVNPPCQNTAPLPVEPQPLDEQRLPATRIPQAVTPQSGQRRPSPVPYEDPFDDPSRANTAPQRRVEPQTHLEDLPKVPEVG